MKKNRFKNKKRVVVKIGSSSLTHPKTGNLDFIKLERLVRELCDLRNQDIDVCLVSSGAISVGRKMMGGQSTNIPLKVKTAGVIPIIFASSIMSFPGVIAQFAGKTNGTGIGSEILRGLSSSNWCNPSQIKYTWGLLVYVVLCVFFAYFYTSITFNPLEVADNIKKQGGFIPGIRPGKPTSDYLTKMLNYIIFIGAVGLIIVAVIPFFFNGVFGANVSFGGTSIIIVVGVVLETVKQIESQLLVRNYKGFLNN